jgi:hypothetical protein
MRRERLGARGRLLLLVTFFACFVFILAIVFNLVKFEPKSYELTSERPQPGGSMEPANRSPGRR